MEKVSRHKVSRHFTMNYHTIPDMEIIRFDFLIANIEKAFSQWKEGEWATHVSFKKPNERKRRTNFYVCRWRAGVLVKEAQDESSS